MDYSFLNSSYCEENEFFRVSRYPDIPTDYKIAIQQRPDVVYRIFDNGWVVAYLDPCSLLLWNTSLDVAQSKHSILLPEKMTSGVELTDISAHPRESTRCVCLGSDGKIFVWHSSDSVPDFWDFAMVRTPDLPLGYLRRIGDNLYLGICDPANFVIFRIEGNRVLLSRGIKRRSLIGEIGSRVGSLFFGNDSVSENPTLDSRSIVLSNVFLDESSFPSLYYCNGRTLFMLRVTADSDLKVIWSARADCLTPPLRRIEDNAVCIDGNLERCHVLSMRQLCGRLFLLLSAPPQPLTKHRYSLVLCIVEYYCESLVMTETLWQRSFNFLPAVATMESPLPDQEEVFLRLDDSLISVSAFGCLEVQVGKSPRIAAVGVIQGSLAVVAQRGIYRVQRNPSRLCNTGVFDGVSDSRGDIGSRLINAYFRMCQGNIRSAEDSVSILLSGESSASLWEALVDCSRWIIFDRSLLPEDAVLTDDTDAAAILSRAENHRNYLHFLVSSRILPTLLRKCPVEDWVDQLVLHSELVNALHRVASLKLPLGRGGGDRGEEVVRSVFEGHHINLSALGGVRGDVEAFSQIMIGIFEGASAANREACRILGVERGSAWMGGEDVRRVVCGLVSLCDADLPLARAALNYAGLQRESPRFWEFRRQLCSAVVVRSEESALALAEEFVDFETIMEICQQDKYRERLALNVGRFPPGLDEEAFSWLMARGKKTFCLFSGTFQEERLAHFLRKDGPFGMFAWAHFLNVGRSHQALQSLMASLPRTSSLEVRRWLASLAKLILCGFSDERLAKCCDAIERELLIIAHNDVVSKFYPECRGDVYLGCDQIINLYLRQPSLSEHQFQLLCELASLVDYRRSVMLQVMVKSVREDRWDDIPEFRFADYCLRTKTYAVVAAFVANGSPVGDIPSLAELMSQAQLSEHRNHSKCRTGLHFIFNSFV